MKKYIKDLINNINSVYDFTINYCEEDNSLEFETNEEKIGDFIFNVECGNNLEDFKDNLKNYLTSYDIDYETYIWIGNDGHGKNGAPYHIIDIIQNMTNRKNILKELLSSVNDF